MNAPVLENEQKSAAAGAKIFPGSDSRSYNYYEPKGRRATHYEDVTVDVQPDPERYLLQDWIISFGDGVPTYSKDWTALKSSDWHRYRAPDQEWERTHYQRQSTICGMIKNVIDNARRAGAPKRFDAAWVKVLQEHLGAFKHAEYGAGTSLMRAQRYGYTQMVNNAILTNSSYKLRLAQDLTLYLGEIALDIDGFDVDAGKRAWLESPIWQKTRELVECARGANDFLEQYFIVNVLFEPLIGELFRSGFLMQAAAPQNDYSTPSVVSAAEADYERNLANTVELFAMLVADAEHGEANRRVLHDWFDKYQPIATQAAMDLQPIWSQPRVKSAQFAEAYASAINRLQAIVREIGVFATQVPMPGLETEPAE
ncbi:MULTISPECIES: aromatic/alkene monooxygenase hydroxylase subunit beta [unclassified Novosphingobium]|uniref:aromatic/alkene monooxygenase hydroxylase subunit beta n=1 Tax=unclassified Novosphingobium TaxID=2644732 RepID=UPI0008687006|nr:MULTISPECIES: aromatic/alkene monooxygenase hydroxylase subunit beta [unclassified Novosphingobium]MDR6708666.1 propane monooxygenase small subunit [Novosphingobium sp. 1748]ODU81983.1 MAG: toluene hydroxylase [Novosphingobium sp. SCN 63-17]OJX96707.1 MAG: toluene hydroxylase [Novosphingobium sp. 63-713]